MYAKEQDKQFERLMKSLREFSEEHGIPTGRRVAVYLTNDGRPASTAPAVTDPTIAVFNLRRDTVFRAFSGALSASSAERKSLLLEKLLEAYESSLATLI